jgi:quinol-cytochrome oxidoreductase complex cytochrome b subunit
MSQRTDDPGLFTEPTSSIGPVDRTDPAADRRRFFRRPRQTRVVIRKVGPWSVLKFSLLFYFCIMLVILLALGMLYSVLGAIGALDSVTKLAREVLSEKTFEVHGDWIFTRLTLIGIAMVFLWSLINVFVAFLYNLISDVVGGIEVTLAERR